MPASEMPHRPNVRYGGETPVAGCGRQDSVINGSYSLKNAGDNRYSKRPSNIAKNETSGAHDSLIGATALRHGHGVLTNHGRDFRKLPGPIGIDWVAPAP